MDGMREKGGTEPAGLSERPQQAGGDKSAGGPPGWIDTTPASHRVLYPC
jgi:hypothetical protein